MEKLNKKKIAVYIFICAGIVGVASIFIWLNRGSGLASILSVAAVAFVLNLILRGAGTLIARRFNLGKWARRALLAVSVLITVLVLFCGVILSIQDSMLFYGYHDEESRSLMQGKPGYSEIEFTAENGKTYYGMMYRAAESEPEEKSPLVIYFGGNGELSYRHMRSKEESDYWKYYTGYNYMFIDYEGYGLSGGNPGYKNMYEGALAAYDYAVTLPYVDSSRIVTTGYSLGTGSAVYLAANRPVTGLVLAAPYANGYDLYNSMFPIFYGPARWLVKQKLPSDKYASDVTCPVLIIASRNDETVSFETTMRLAKSFPDGVKMIELSNVAHNEVWTDGALEGVQEFLSGLRE